MHNELIISYRTVIERGWWLILALLVCGVLYLASWIPRLDINANTDAFIEEESVSVSDYYETRADWGTDEFGVLCLTADDWFTEKGIQRLLDIEADVKQVPWVSSTMSILDVPLLRQKPREKPGLMFLVNGMKSLRKGKVDMAAAAAEHADHEITVGNLISHDGKSVNMLAYLDWSKMEGKSRDEINVRRAALVEGIRTVAAKWSQELDEPIRLSGIPFIQISLFENMRQDLIVFGWVSLGLFTLGLLLVYRRLRFVLIPIVCCVLPPVGILGGMAFLGIPIGFVTSNMPVLLFVLMLPYNIYFIERYRERRTQFPEEDGLTSTLTALSSIALPCLFSCATTLAGFIALGTSKIIPISNFGQSMTAGMVVGFAMVFLFIGVVSRKLPGLEIAKVNDRTAKRTPGLVKFLEEISLKRPAWVLLFCFGLLAVALVGVGRLNAQSKFTNYFWPGSEVYDGLEFIDQKMGGTTWIEVILTSSEPGYFKTDAGLNALATAEAYFEPMPETGNILSLTSLRDEMRKLFKPEWFPNLTDSALLAMVNMASSDLVRQTTNAEFSNSRTTIRMMETAPNLDRNAILDGLHAHLKTHEAIFKDVDVQVTGVFPVYATMLKQLIIGQKESILVVGLAVFVMLVLLFRSPILALIVAIPQAVPATVVLGVIGWCGIPLDLVTVMIGSIAIGVGIDAAIQYTMRFRSELETCGDPRIALSRTHATIGRAIWIATTIIILGFSILVLSNFFPSVWFGLFTALAMLISQLATLTMLPSLFLMTGYPKPRRDF